MPPKRETAPITPDPIDTALLPGFSAVPPPASTVQLPQPPPTPNLAAYLPTPMTPGMTDQPYKLSVANSPFHPQTGVPHMGPPPMAPADAAFGAQAPTIPPATPTYPFATPGIGVQHFARPPNPDPASDFRPLLPQSVAASQAVSYTHLTLPTNREV